MDGRVRPARQAPEIKVAPDHQGHRRSFRGRQATWVSQGKAADRLDRLGQRASLAHRVRLDLLDHLENPGLLAKVRSVASAMPKFPATTDNSATCLLYRAAEPARCGQQDRPCQAGGAADAKAVQRPNPRHGAELPNA
jgi:hypothetical protein